METEKTLLRPGGITLYYRLWRPGAPRTLIVLLHGMASNLTRWSEFVEHTFLKERFDILRPDLRGHGRSFTRKKINMRLWCEDLDALLDAEGYERAILVGHSLGANLALHFAAHRPQRTAAIALIDPVLTQALQGPALWIHRTSLLWRPLIAVARWLNLIGIRRRVEPLRDLRRLDEDVRERLLKSGNAEAFVKRYSSPLADLRHFSTANYLQEFIEITKRVPGPDAIRAPLLALVSQAVTFSRADITREALGRYHEAQIVELSAYHWPLTEKPLEVRRELEQWCARFETCR